MLSVETKPNDSRKIFYFANKSFFYLLSLKPVRIEYK